MATNNNNNPSENFTGFLICIKVLGLFSMVASSFIMRDVFLKLRRGSLSSTRSWHQNISLTQSVIFCLSVGDFFSAFFVQFLSTWMVPSFVNVSLASGSVTSCTVQGFFGSLFYGLSACSNASLAVAYSLIVKFGWRDENKDRYRLPFTIIPIIFGMALAIIPLPGQNYNWNGSFYCDITASPLGCDYDDSPETQCTRGSNARIVLLYVGVIPFMVLFAIIIAAVVLLIYDVLVQERRMDRYRREGMPLNRSMTNQSTRQGIYYIGAFGLAWIPWYIFAIIEFHQGDIPMSLAVIHYITMPLQGVFNALVYFRPKYKSDRGRNPSQSRTSSVLRVLKISLPAVNCYCRGSTKQESNEARKSTIMHAVEENENEEQKMEEELVEEEKYESSNVIVSDTVDEGVKEKSVQFSDIP